MKFGVSVLMLAFVASLPGCVAEDYCESLGNCGGDLAPGTDDFYRADQIADTDWIGTLGDECQDQGHTPPIQATLIGQPTHFANEAPPDRSSMEWCSNLVYKSDGSAIKSVNLWYPAIPLETVKLTISKNGNYSVQFKYVQKQVTEFSHACLTAQGVAPTCEKFSADMKTVLSTEPNITDVSCSKGPQGGCRCTYEMLLVTGPEGPYRSKGGTVVFYDALSSPPSEVEYCVKGDTLELTGKDQTWLFNERTLRTLKLKRASCSDGVLDQGEAGVDCGGPCPAACPE